MERDSRETNEIVVENKTNTENHMCRPSFIYLGVYEQYLE